MEKLPVNAMIVKMWDGTSTAKKNRDGSPAEFKSFVVRYNYSIAKNRRG